MKVLHLSHSDGGSGAGRAAHRIHTSFRDAGVDSKMLVSQKRTSDISVEPIARDAVGRLRNRVYEYLEAKVSQNLAVSSSEFLSFSHFSLFEPQKHFWVQEADVIVSYWVNGAFATPENLASLSKPLIWRLSDCWPFTGGCHYHGNCDRFEFACGSCPKLRFPSPSDASHKLWARKRVLWRSLDLTVVTPSHWMATLARRSSLFADRRIEVIPTGVDLTVYRPIDRSSARKRWGIPENKLVIAFGAMSPEDDRRKGYDKLKDALHLVSRSSLASEVWAVTFGSNSFQPEDLPVDSVSLGRLESDEELVSAYNLADVIVVPSLEDNLPNMALEAIACGTPIVAFDVCGMPDIVRDQCNGRLVNVEEQDSLGRAILEMLSDLEQLSIMRTNAREHAEKNFSLRDQAHAFLSLCEQVGQGHH